MRDLGREVGFGRRPIYQEYLQAEPDRFVGDLLRESLVTFQQTFERKRRVGRAKPELVGRRPTLEHATPKTRRRDQPNGVPRFVEKRMHEGREEPEPLGDGHRPAGLADEIGDDRIEAPASKPRKRLE